MFLPKVPPVDGALLDGYYLSKSVSQYGRSCAIAALKEASNICELHFYAFACAEKINALRKELEESL